MTLGNHLTPHRQRFHILDMEAMESLNMMKSNSQLVTKNIFKYNVKRGKIG